MEREVVYKGQILTREEQELRRKYYVEEFTEKHYRIKISKETQEKIGEIKQFLEENKDFSYMIMFNHTYYGDPLFAGYLANLIDPENTRQIVAPVSALHTKPKEGNLSLGKRAENLFTKTINEMAQSATAKTLSVVQANDKTSSTEEAQKSYFEFFDELKRLKNDGPIGLIVCPEGHRSEDGKMQSFERGSVLMAKSAKPLVVIGLGIHFEPRKFCGMRIRSYFRDTLNHLFNRKINLTVNNYLIINKEDKIPKTEVMEQMVADALPVDLVREENLSEERKKELAQMPKTRTFVWKLRPIKKKH
ncbi:MAG: 1-acyl-sn-glycerol-3-phosphate acyltransferase [Candidatus Shapirobacteria bacterium]|nr:1-acyl-sn-glycerol-3-phosphate acyltransferase [Candidatus Shapirobacteria bacterium]